MTEKVLDNNIDLSEKFESRNSIAAIDWGLNCAVNNLGFLFIYSLIPSVIEIAVSYTSYKRTLNPQQLFLAFVLTALSTAWLITSASMISFEVARDKEIKPLELAFSALKNLPKILLSYLGLLAILLIAFYVQPLLLILVFLIWAPIFCVAEIYSWIDKPAPDPEEYDFMDDEQENFFTRKTIIKDDEASLFAGKSAFELGFARSLQLSFRNLLTTLQAGLIVWCGNVVPAAVIGFFLSEKLGFFPEALKILVSTFFQSISICAICGAFLLLLTEKSQTELGISTTSKSWINLNTKPIISLHKNIFASLLLALVAVGSTALFFNQLKQTRIVPSDLKVELVSSGMRSDKFTMSLKMHDQKALFRWLDPESFRLKINDKLLLPTAFQISTEAGESEETRVYNAGPLMLKLEFEANGFNEYELQYSTMFAEPQKIYSGNLK